MPCDIARSILWLRYPCQCTHLTGLLNPCSTVQAYPVLRAFNLASSLTGPASLVTRWFPYLSDLLCLPAVVSACLDSLMVPMLLSLGETLTLPGSCACLLRSPRPPLLLASCMGLGRPGIDRRADCAVVQVPDAAALQGYARERAPSPCRHCAGP